jgi:ABC-type amino acid transport substrate-binding protein
MVVPAGATLTKLEQIGDEPLAAELGVAARGLEGRKTKTYSSLDDILDAVAAKQVKAGYVISTRGNYLAHKRLPDKLMFLDGEAADRFPICAAVRKSDADLRDAIDQAWEELAESGKLEEVFTRWHIPYVAPPQVEKSRKDR